MSDSCTWPEQDALDQWWRDHGFEAKKAATEYRVKMQREYEDTISSLQSQLAQVTQERDEARAREAGSREALTRVVVEGNSWPDFVNGIQQALSTPSPAYDEWKAMRAVCLAAEEADGAERALHHYTLTHRGQPSEELQLGYHDAWHAMCDALAAWKEARP